MSSEHLETPQEPLVSLLHLKVGIFAGVLLQAVTLLAVASEWKGQDNPLADTQVVVLCVSSSIIFLFLGILIYGLARESKKVTLQVPTKV